MTNTTDFEWLHPLKFNKLLNSCVLLTSGQNMLYSSQVSVSTSKVNYTNEFTCTNKNLSGPGQHLSNNKWARWTDQMALSYLFGQKWLRPGIKISCLETLLDDRYFENFEPCFPRTLSFENILRSDISSSVEDFD